MGGGPQATSATVGVPAEEGRWYAASALFQAFGVRSRKASSFGISTLPARASEMRRVASFTTGAFLLHILMHNFCASITCGRHPGR